LFGRLEQLAEKINAYRLKNFKLFYILLIALIAILTNQVLQYKQNQELNEQLNDLKHQILVNHVGLDTNDTNKWRTLDPDQLFNLIKQINNNSELDIHFSALVRSNDKFYIMKTRLNETIDVNKAVSFSLP